MGDDLVVRSIPMSVNDKLRRNNHHDLSDLDNQQPFRREEENELNAIRPSGGEGRPSGGDLVFSDGYSEVAEDYIVPSAGDSLTSKDFL